MDEWQPIETAPKDVKLILLDKIGVCRAPCEWSPAGEISEEGFWLWWQAAPEYLTEVVDPAHWMPLPEPPKGKTDG